jgi:hypothetical protein
MPFGLVLASLDFTQDWSGTPVKYWRTIIEQQRINARV